jgi:hypothetical protein
MRNNEVYILSKKKSRIRPFNRDMKRWIPSPALQRVFSETFDACGLDESERDEIRKIYFLWFKKNYEVIKKGTKTRKNIAVHIPNIGFIAPHWRPVAKRIDYLSTGNYMADAPEKQVKKEFNLLINDLVRTCDNFVKFFNKIKPKSYAAITIESRSDYYTKEYFYIWARNFGERGYNIEGIPYEQSHLCDTGILF